MEQLGEARRVCGRRGGGGPVASRGQRRLCLPKAAFRRKPAAGRSRLPYRREDRPVAALMWLLQNLVAQPVERLRPPPELGDGLWAGRVQFAGFDELAGFHVVQRGGTALASKRILRPADPAIRRL